ncbi:hypothetical protein Kintu_gp78 [Xanthomonas phage Kintu]
MTKGDREKLRAELAGKAMAALIQNPTAMTRIEMAIEINGKGSRSDKIAESAVIFADALMKELGLDGE